VHEALLKLNEDSNEAVPKLVVVAGQFLQLEEVVAGVDLNGQSTQQRIRIYMSIC
jgi:hypothetical protein